MYFSRCLSNATILTFLLLSLVQQPASAFQSVSFGVRRANPSSTSVLSQQSPDVEDCSISRRSLLSSCAIAALGLSTFPREAMAGIDVSGLKVEGGGGNAELASQLKAYDGSGSARVREVKAIQETSVSPTKTTPSVTKSESAVDDREAIATWAYRANPVFNPTLTRAGPFGNLYRYNDAVVAPSTSKRRSIGVQFEFPSDWLQLDRTIGGIQYVDQRNGDKLYVFRAPLPADTSLETVPKATIGDLIFDPKGSLAKSGQTIEEYKVSSAQTLSDCPNNMCATHRRFKIKYATVTGNGLRVERRALVDAYQVEDDVYMLMTSSNAVKFEQKDSLERETVEKIVASFQIEA